ncbi:phosphatidate cytidylyltransferase [Micromonospora sp. NPDC000089]|uniref:phosphatidate cytidylyltransferase n=1 Tax=unclassified Micromonospora TaxID=2617518 RepID=UPI003684C9F2
MTDLDPYGGTEPRGWDRPDRPTALPWPERDVEPWSRQSGPDLYARPQPLRRDQPDVDPFDAPPADRHGDPYQRPGHPNRGAERPDRSHPGYDDRPAHDDRYDRGLSRDNRGPGRPGRDDDVPTSQFAPIRDDASFRPLVPDAAATEQFPSVRAEPERAPSGRRQRGRRRASADRPATQQAAPGRAGRNLPAAIGVGLGLGAAIVVPLVFYPPAFLAVLAAAVAIGTWEMARAVRRSGAHPPLVPLLAGGLLTLGLAWFAGPDALSLGLLVTVLGTMIWRIGDGPAGFQRDLTAATLIAVYVPFLAGFAALLAAAPGDGPLRVLVTVVAVVLSDTGGYAAGVTFGKHPMAPSISPKKSWEGFAGSVTAAALGSALLIWLLFDVAPWWGALFGVAVSVAAVLGDLAESMIKRDLGVKDMSNLLPGHGGLMDRLDSVLFAVPTAYLLLAVFVPVVG